VFVDQGQDAQTAVLFGLVVKQIPTPDLIALFGAKTFRATGSQATHSPLALADLQPGLAPNPLHSLGIDSLALTPQQRREPAVAITRMLLAQLDDLEGRLPGFFSGIESFDSAEKPRFWKVMIVGSRQGLVSSQAKDEFTAIRCARIVVRKPGSNCAGFVLRKGEVS
jgi:hypothetical protein